MARSEELTDVKLRRKLQDLGSDPGPISSKNRDICRKKLNHLLVSQRKNMVTTKRINVPKLVGYSSDESDGESKGKNSFKSPEKLFGSSYNNTNNSYKANNFSDSKKYVSNKTVTSPFTSLFQSMFGSKNNTKNRSTSDNSDFDSSDDDSVSYFDVCNRGTNTSPYNSPKSALFTPSKSSNSQNRSFLSNLSSSLSDSVSNLTRKPLRSYNNCITGKKSDHINRNLNRTEKRWSPYSDSTFKTHEELVGYFSRNISMVLLIFAALFFILLGLMYLSVQNKDTNVPAYKTLPSDEKSMDKNIRRITRELTIHLRYITGLNVCGVSKKINMSYSEVVEFTGLYNKQDIRLKLMESIFKNADQGIRIFNENNRLLVEGDNLSEIKWFSSLIANKPLLCRLQEAICKVFYQFIMLLSLCCIVAGIFLFLCWKWRKQEREQALIYEFVEKIIEILHQHNEHCQKNTSLDPYLPIPHVRDILIPIHKRKSLQKVWDKAVNFLSENESRIRVESQCITGEDFTVWRWLTKSPLPQKASLRKIHNGSKEKVWQGQAFENLDSGVNALPFSPTPCLKIRNMFDPDVEYEENWHIHIQDAILEKSGSGCKILHIVVDKSSKEGCVYLKCSSPEDAGQAYRSLHGWWFDGSLITVKYLRLERYHERFPDSIYHNQPLLSSNIRKISGQHSPSSGGEVLHSSASFKH